MNEMKIIINFIFMIITLRERETTGLIEVDINLVNNYYL